MGKWLKSWTTIFWVCGICQKMVVLKIGRFSGPPKNSPKNRVLKKRPKFGS